MNNKVVLFAVLTAFTLTVNAAPGKLSPQSRKDYKYSEERKDFLKLHKEKRTFQDAKNICQQEEAVLAFWDSDTKMYSFASMQKAIWIGVYIKNSTLYSSDGTNINKLASTYMINTQNYNQNRLHWICMINGEISTACPEKMSFICCRGLKNNVKYFLPNNSVPFYRNDYTYNEKNNYALKKHTPQLWNDANKVCEGEGAELLTVDEDDDVSELTSMLSTRERFWLGASDLLVESQYETMNGKPLTKPINITFGHCVTINDVGIYESKSCQENIMFLCQKRFESYNFECNTVDSEYRAISGNDKCIKYHKEPKTWHDALEICKVENATLFIINDENEAFMLRDNLLKIDMLSGVVNVHYDHSILHIGFHDLYIEGLYRTVNGDLLKDSGYEVWSTFYPKPYMDQRCGGMVKNGTLQNGPCNVPALFACQKLI